MALQMAASRGLFFLLAALFPFLAFAQTQPPDVAGAVPLGRARVEYGVRFGPSFTTLTSVETFDPDVVARAPEPTMNFGGFLMLDIPGPFVFQPEVLFAARGHRIHDKDARPVFTGTATEPPQADRVILIRYLEIPLLLRASNQTGEDSSVYLIGGPAFALRRNAVIREVADAGKLETITDEVTGTNLSLVFGAGLQHERWLVDARFTRGLGNVAVSPQPAEVKTGAFSVLMGVRF